MSRPNTAQWCRGMAVNASIELLKQLLAGADPGVTVDSCQVTLMRRDHNVMLYRVKVDGTTSRRARPIRWTRSFVCKTLVASSTADQVSAACTLYRNELAVYTLCLPTLIAFQASRAERLSTTFKAVAACYCARSNRLVLEDLRERGFKTVDCADGLNYAQSALVLRELARMHSLSLAMKRKAPQQFSERVGTVHTPGHETWYRHHYKETARVMFAMLRRSQETEKYSNVEHFESFMNSSQLFEQTMNSALLPEPMGVLCHGDCRTNNIMFQQSSEGDVLQVCLVGFQRARVASPSLDVSTLLYCCTTHELRANNLLHLLHEYHTALCTQLGQLLGAVSEDDMFSPHRLWDILLYEFQSCGHFALGIALDILSKLASHSNQAPSELDEGREVQRTLVAKYIPTMIYSEPFLRKVAELVEDLRDSGDN